MPPDIECAFYLLSGSMIHDIYSMRVALGIPTKVQSSDIWFNGRVVTMNLEYANGSRCVASWIDLPDYWDFHETLEVYGDDKRVLVTYPTGFAPRGMLATVSVQGIDENGTHYKKEPKIDWESAFMREMRHFYECVRNGESCRTPVESARDDIDLIINIVKTYQGR